MGTPGGYVEGFGEKISAFGWKYFPSIRKYRSPLPFGKFLDLACGTSKLGLIFLISGGSNFDEE